jgi:hypothetical protein
VKEEGERGRRGEREKYTQSFGIFLRLNNQCKLNAS